MDKSISVVGLGRLGLPLAVALASRGFYVIGVDIDPGVVEDVRAFRIPPRIHEPGLVEYLARAEGNLVATQDVSMAVQETAATIVLVGTPSSADGSFSLAFVLNVCQELGIHLRGRDSYHTIIISSTVLPGSCDGPIREELEKTSGRKIGKSLGLCYCPEFVALGDVIQGFLEPDFVLIGASDMKARYKAQQVYNQLCRNDPYIAHTTLINAEIAKLALNCYISTKMTFANMLAELCENIRGADVDAVTNAIGLDSRVGRKYLTGATAYGGLTFPMAIRSLLGVAESVGIELPLIEAIDSTNWRQNERLAAIIRRWHIGDKAKIGILGLTYKPGISATENSAGVILAQLLNRFHLIAYDPAVQAKQLIKSIEAHADLSDVISTPWLAESAQTCVDYSDIIVVTTPWPEFKDVQFHEGQVVIDCWRIYDRQTLERQGVHYVAIGVGPCERSLWSPARAASSGAT